MSVICSPEEADEDMVAAIGMFFSVGCVTDVLEIKDIAVKE